MRELLVEAHVEIWVGRTLRLLYKYLNQIVRIAYWQRPQQETIHQRKDQRGRSDSDGYQKRSRSEEGRSAAQLSNRITEILHEQL